MARNPVCIGCGQPTGPGPRLNRLADGRSCPTCQDRLLESLPALLPSLTAAISAEEWADEGDDPDGGDDYRKGA